MLGLHSEQTEDPLDNDTNKRILLLTSKQELTAPAIAYALHLPLAECYRKIAALTAAGYLTIAGYKVNVRRHAMKVYRAKLDGIELFYSRDKVVMKVPKREPGLEGMNIEVIVPRKRQK
jgi:hypothetical protein